MNFVAERVADERRRNLPRCSCLQRAYARLLVRLVVTLWRLALSVARIPRLLLG
jgi:hypothetical protein